MLEELWVLILVEFSPLKLQKFIKSNFCASKISKWLFQELQESQKLISRKISIAFNSVIQILREINLDKYWAWKMSIWCFQTLWILISRKISKKKRQKNISFWMCIIVTWISRKQSIVNICNVERSMPNYYLVIISISNTYCIDDKIMLGTDQ